MKRFNRFFLIIGFLFFFGVFIPKVSDAQIGVDCDYQDPDFPCPIDGGLYVVLAVGIIYGIKRINDEKKAASAKEH